MKKIVIRLSKIFYKFFLLISVGILLTFLVMKFQKPILKFFYPIEFCDIVSEASETYGVEKEFIYAIIKCESGFDPNAKSKANAIGLMQITPDTFEWLQKSHTHKKISLEELSSPKINIMYGTLLISILREKYDDEKVALCAYNAGETTTKRWLNDKNFSLNGKTLNKIPYKETFKYVRRVMSAKKIYKKLYFE